MTETDKPMGARETYNAYVRGEITLEEAAKRAQAWYASRHDPSSRPPTPQE